MVSHNTSLLPGPPVKAFGYGLSIACDGTVKALWALVKFPSQVSERKRLCLLKARCKDPKMPQPASFSWHGGLPCSINWPNSSSAGEGHQALLLPCLSPRGWLQRDSRKNNPDSDKQEDKLFVSSQTLSVSVAWGRAFLLWALVKQSQVSLPKA